MFTHPFSGYTNCFVWPIFHHCTPGAANDTSVGNLSIGRNIIETPMVLKLERNRYFLLISDKFHSKRTMQSVLSS